MSTFGKRILHETLNSQTFFYFSVRMDFGLVDDGKIVSDTLLGNTTSARIFVALFKGA